MWFRPGCEAYTLTNSSGGFGGGPDPWEGRLNRTGADEIPESFVGILKKWVWSTDQRLGRGHKGWTVCSYL